MGNTTPYILFAYGLFLSLILSHLKALSTSRCLPKKHVYLQMSTPRACLPQEHVYLNTSTSRTCLPQDAYLKMHTSRCLPQKHV